MYLVFISVRKFFTAIKERIRLNDIADLIRLASNGDRSSFDMLIKICNKDVIAIARYFTDDEAEDIAQNVWLKIWSKYECLKDVDNFFAWIFQVTRFQCIDYLRKNSLKKEKVSISYEENHELIDALYNCNTTDEMIVKSETTEVLKKYIYELNEIYSIPMTLYYFEDFSLSEVAQYLGLPVSTIKWRLYIGRQLMKKTLLKGGFFDDQETSN
ncbi:MAG: RNA polymerase sigma factor [Armatimonadota bacterium]